MERKVQEREDESQKRWFDVTKVKKRVKIRRKKDEE